MPNPIPFISAARPVFPEYSPAHDKHDGLVCVSDALTPEMLLAAYRKGVFPWFSEHGLFYWFAQHPRAVLLPERLHIGRSLAKTLRRKSYRVSVNACFAEVIAACAQIPRAEQGGTWITPDFQAAYTAPPFPSPQLPKGKNHAHPNQTPRPDYPARACRLRRKH